MKRKTTGKRIRFEIFKRDGFRCVYCGTTPVQSELRIDHVIPVADGGPSTIENLVTSCHDCNAGKSSISLDKKIQKSDLAKKQKDHAEQIKSYLKIQKEIADARLETANQLADYWQQVIGPMSQDMFNRLTAVIKDWDYNDIIEAIDITGAKLGVSNNEYSSWKATNQAKYFHGILREWKSEAENG